MGCWSITPPSQLLYAITILLSTSWGHFPSQNGAKVQMESKVIPLEKDQRIPKPNMHPNGIFHACFKSGAVV